MNDRPFRSIVLILVFLVALVAARIFMAGKPGPAASPPKTSPAAPVAAASPPPASSPAQDKFFAQLKLEDAEEKLTPITLGNMPFTVVVHKKRLVWPAEAAHKFDPDFDENAVSFEIRAADNSIAYRKDLAANLSPEQWLAQVRRDGGFGFSTSVSAIRLQGVKGQAMLVDWGDLPSTPDACSTFLVLGLRQGKLQPFAEPYCGHWELTVDPKTMTAKLGRFVPLPTEAPVRTITGETRTREDLAQDDIIQVRYNTSRFNVLFPVQVDFAQGSLRPAQQCLIMTAADGKSMPRYEDICDYPVLAERYGEKEETFVRLYPQPDEGATPRHVVVKPNSKVEFLAARAHNIMNNQGKWNESLDESPWLKVRIDGKVGWVRSGEDLDALGLLQAG